MAVCPNVVPAVWLTWPLAGLVRLPQSTAVEKKNTYVCTYSLLPEHTVLDRWEIKRTLTGRFIPRPHSISLTCVSTVSHQVVACVTTIGGGLSKCCSIGTNLAIGWVSQSATVHSCWRKDEHICIMYSICYQRLLGRYFMIVEQGWVNSVFIGE